MTIAEETAVLPFVETDEALPDGAQPLDELTKLPEPVAEPAEILELRGELARGRVPAWVGDNTPFLTGAKHWCELMGTRHQEAQRYRSSLTFALLALGVSVVGNVVQGLGPRAIPYIVQVDRTGYTVAIGPAQRTDGADERVLIAYSGLWIRALRTVEADKVSQRGHLKQVYAMLATGTGGHRKAVDWLTKNNPLVASDRRVDVELTRVAPLENGNVMTVEWIEHERSGAATTSESFYSALLTITISRGDRKQEEVLANPGGLFVTDYAISKIR